MNFTTVKSIKIPEGVVKTLSINGQVVWRKKANYPITYTEPFHFITKTENKVRLVRQPESKTYVTLEYSTDNVNWKPWGSTESGTLEMSMEPNSKLYLRGNNTHFGEDYMWYGANRFESDSPIDSAGDISSLVDVNNMQPNTFAGLFHQFRNLKSAPRLNLPILPNSCYSNTFRDSGIRSVDLSLIHVAPDRGIGETFIDCTDLVDIKYPTDLTVGKWGTFFGTFQNSGITTPFDFNFKGNGSETYYRAWSNTKIKSVKINVKNWDESRYTECFQGSKDLSFIDFSSVDTASVVERNWVLDVAPKGIFVKKASVELPRGPHGIPEGWTVMTPEEYEASQKRFHFKNVSGKPNTVKLVKSNETESPTVTLQKSNNGVDYTPCDIYTGITLQPGEVVYLKGQNNTLANKDNHNHFTSIGDIESYGSIMDLVDNGTDTTSITTSYQFRGLFSMMNYLKITPELPAATLSEGCYTLMFEGCKNITSIKLPATTLVDNCYADMFLWCEKLNNIEISATTWSNNPTWVNGVSKTGTFTKPTALQIGNGVGQIPKDSVSGIPEGWIVKNVGPKPDVSRRFRFENINGAPNTLKLKKENLQAANVTLQRSNDGINYEPCDIYSGIILQPHEVVYLKGNNNSLEYNNFSSTQPIECHGSVMDLIDGCTDTTIIKSDGCFSGLFENMKTLQSAPLLPATTLTNACYYSMFKYCENLIQAPELPATNLTSQCYEFMFYSCKALKIAPKLKSTTLAVRCYRSMFEKCTSLTQAPELPATTLVERCYRNMFYDCTSLTTAPKIPATKYANQWGMHMFCGCSKLNHIEVNFTSWKTADASDWTLHVPPTGTFIKPKELVVWDGTGTQPAGSIPLNSTSGIPTGWKVVDI